MTNTAERQQRQGSIIAVLRNRFSAAALAVYSLLAVGFITSLVVGSAIGAAVAAVGAGAVVLLVALDVRVRMSHNASALMREMREVRRKAIGSHDYAVRVENRAKFRYGRLSANLAKANAENTQQLAALKELRGVMAARPEPITEEILKKRFSALSSRMTKLLEEAFEAQGLNADAQRGSEIEDMRNIILSALAIQRAELNILADRLLESAPRA